MLLLYHFMDNLSLTCPIYMLAPLTHGGAARGTVSGRAKDYAENGFVKQPKPCINARGFVCFMV